MKAWDELESLRYFDPLTQISREEIASVTIPPGGELAILKKMRSAEYGVRNEEVGEGRGEKGERSQSSEVKGQR